MVCGQVNSWDALSRGKLLLQKNLRKLQRKLYGIQTNVVKVSSLRVARKTLKDCSNGLKYCTLSWRCLQYWNNKIKYYFLLVVFNINFPQFTIFVNVFFFHRDNILQYNNLCVVFERIWIIQHVLTQLLISKHKIVFLLLKIKIIINNLCKNSKVLT